MPFPAELGKEIELRVEPGWPGWARVRDWVVLR